MSLDDFDSHDTAAMNGWDEDFDECPVCGECGCDTIGDCEICEPGDESEDGDET